VEIFFTQDDSLKTYYGIEIDAYGRVLDYVGAFYRNTDLLWDCDGLKIASTISKNGYIVEGSIPLLTLEKIGVIRPGKVIRAGVFRGEFSYGPEREIIQHWISWVDPMTEKPDFHVPSAFGMLRLIP
jgi:chondroitin AC lyase